MEWISLLVSGLIFPAFWYIARKLTKLKENELCHIEKAIVEVKTDVKALTDKFIDHLENHAG